MRPNLSLLFAATLLAAVPAHAEQAHLVLLHTSDLHGHLFDDDRPGGLARVATQVAAARADSLPTLFVDAGDALFGSAFATASRTGPAGKDPVVAAMNALGYDASVAGNHEFDDGLATFDRLRDQASFPFLAANLARTDGGRGFPGSIVRMVGGIRVGVVGVTTPALAAIGSAQRLRGVAATSALEAARREIAALRAGGRCDVVVVLAHTGLGADPRTGAPRPGDVPDEQVGQALAQGLPDADVLVLGHSHVVIPERLEGGVLVVQAGRNGEGLGRVDLTLERANAKSPWRVTERKGRFLPAAGAAPEPAFLERFEPDRAAAERALDQVVGHATAPIGSPDGRLSDGPLWQLLNEVQLNMTGAQVSLSALFDPAVAWPAGDIRYRDVLALYPYLNTLVTLRVSGRTLRAALERSVSAYAPWSSEPGAPAFVPDAVGWNLDMAGGAHYEVDLTRPAGQRITGLTVNDRPVADDDSLLLAVNSYRAAGGGGYDMLARAPRVRETSLSIPDLIVEWFAKRGTIAPPAEPSWTLRPAQVGSAARPLIDRLVRLGSLPATDVGGRTMTAATYGARAAADLGRALGWRRGSGDSPDAYVAGLEQKRVLAKGEAARTRALTLATAADWCERAARAAKWPLAPRRDEGFRRGLLTGLPALTAPGRPADQPLTEEEWLGMLANLRWPELRVLETTDFHGAILPTTDRRSGRPVGGTVALAAAIESERAANPEGTVLLDGGDCFQGTMVSNLEYGRPVVKQMNALAYAAMAVGNHEFDWTLDTLAARVHEMHFAALAANMRERRSGRLPAWVRGDTLFTRRGVRVGVVGLAYPGTPRVTLPANVTTLQFEDDSTWAARTAPRLRKAGAAAVLGVGHIPAETDSTRRARGDLARLARGVRGVDAWFGGHSHNVVADEIAGVPAMIAGSHGQWVAVCDVVVDPVAGRVLEHRTRMRRVWGDELTPDSTVWQARVAEWNANIAPIAAEVIGRTETALDRERPESTIGDFITDAMREQTGVDVALQNPGGMRANLDAGPITRGEVYEIMPFDNTIVTMKLTGAELRLALEQSLGYGRITQVSGIRVVVDPDGPRGERVKSVTWADGSPLDPERTIRVAANNFMASGGDNYDALGKGRESNDTGLVIRGAMEALVRKRCVGGGALGVKRDGRITLAPR